MKRRRLVLILSVMLLGVATIAASAQLPDESQLPGVSPQTELPPESQLPGGSGRSTGTDGDTGQKPLPSEATLPAAIAQQTDTADAAEQLLRLQQSEDGRPWLRLTPKSHIDRIRTIVFSRDSQRLFVAGDDKQVMVYRRTPDDSFGYERTVRWQIQRGQSGRIYSLATAPGLLAIGGYGAMGSLGEILLLDPQTGNLLQPLVTAPEPHHQRLTALSFSPEDDNPSLASMDQDGRLLLWRKNAETGVWEGKQLAYAPEKSVSLQLDRVLHPVVAVSRERIVAPLLADKNGGQARWQIVQYDVDGQTTRLSKPNEFHASVVTAMASSASGTRLASADAQSQLFLYDLTGAGTSTKQAIEGVVASMAFSRDGTRLAIGTGFAGQKYVQLWDVSDRKLSVPFPPRQVAGDVYACDLSPDGKFLAYSQEGDVLVCQADRSMTPVVTLNSRTPVPTRVAFSKGRPYRIAFATAQTVKPTLTMVFDPEKGQLDSTQIRQDDWLPSDANRGGWLLQSSADRTRFWLEQNGQRRGTIPLNPQTQGAPTAVGWIPAEGGQLYVAVGTTGSNIYVFRVAGERECELLRVFREHTGAVTSISASHDQRYLASSGTDRTIRIWKLDGLDAGPMMNRWGATFAAGDGDKLVVDSIRDDGPLYFRGLRQGDVLQRLLLVETKDGQQQVVSVTDRNAIIQTLGQRNAAELTAFEYRRGRAQAASFQMFPAWQPVASLYVDPNREWAFWTPAGFYDASFEGHKLFGWQVNRGVNVLPDFFLAAQVRRFFERPAIMSRLLSAGSVPSAFQQARREAPADWSAVLAQQQALRPEISILRPQQGQVVDAGTVEVQAQIRVPAGQKLVPPKAFANGVIGQQRQLVSAKDDGPQVEYIYEWKVAVPSDPELLIQVAAATENEAADQESVTVSQQTPVRPSQSRMFVVAAGVNGYRDAGVPDLLFAADNASGLVQTLKTHGEPRYACQAITLLNDRVTKSTWGIVLSDYAERLRAEATADDLLVIFLSGHGVRDDQTEEYFYVTSNARFDDIKSRRYSDCLSFSDLALFADVPCRKLVILDTCHSGAIQPLRQRELKGALRALQDDVFLTFTASEGQQVAVEAADRKLGRFTYRLIEGLSGQADLDGNRDGDVTLAETVSYVRRRVLEDSANGSHRQYPTAGPRELIERVRIPMTQAAESERTARRSTLLD